MNSIPRYAPYKIVGIYICAGLAWIASSDFLVTSLFPAEMAATLQSAKGFLFVLSTGVMLFFLIRIYVRRLHEALMAAESNLAERHTIEQSLREANSKLSAVISSSPTAIITMDQEGKITSWNGAAERIFGWSEAEVLGHPLPTVPDHAASGCLERRSAVLTGEQISEVEVRRLTKSGALIDVSLSAAPIQSEPGVVSGVMSVIADVSKRKRAEEAVRDSETAYRVTMDACLAGVLVIKGMSISYANPAMAALLGYKAEELIGRNPLEFIVPEHRELVRHNIEARVAGEETRPYEVRHLRRDGNTVETLTWGKLITLHGEPASVTTIIDITERKWVSQSLRNTIERLEDEKAKTEAILGAIGDGVSIQDPSLRIIYQNKAMKEMLGNCVGKFCYKAYEMRESQCEGCPLAKTFADGGIHSALRPAPAGKPDWVEVMTSPLRDATGKITAGIEIVRDVSKRVADEAALRKYKDRLAELTKELGLAEERERRRIANLLHDDVGQALASLKIKVNRVSRELGLDGEMTEIGQVLDYCIANVRSLTAQLSPQILYEVGFAAAIGWLADKFSVENHINVEIGGNYGDTLPEDASVLIFQMVRELLTNVAKHAEARNVRINLEQRGDLLEVVVEDDGKGFSRRHEGHDGFGLFNVRQRMEHIGGAVVVDSVVGRGTKVTLSFPTMPMPTGQTERINDEHTTSRRPPYCS